MTGGVLYYVGQAILCIAVMVRLRRLSWYTAKPKAQQTVILIGALFVVLMVFFIAVEALAPVADPGVPE